MSTISHDLALRRAALAVHAMSPEDRAWLMRELPSPERSRLHPLLAELGEIGIPQDGALLREAVFSPAPASAPQTLDDSEVLSTRAAHALARWLRSQPAQASTRLLAACPGWRQRLLPALPRDLRASVQAMENRLPRAPELERFVLGAARHHIATHAAASRFGWLSGMRSAVARLRKH